MTPGERIRRLLRGEEVDRPSCFSGMGSIVAPAWEGLGYRFPELHHDADKMASAAVKSANLFGHESAVVPFDVCVEAEALGCEVNWFEAANRVIYPKVASGPIKSPADLANFQVSSLPAGRDRHELVCKALTKVKQEVGDHLAVGTYLMGPITITGQLMDLWELYKLTYRHPEALPGILDRLADYLIAVGNLYYRSGADYIALREMGATTDLLMPVTFTNLVKPVVRKIVSGIACPVVLHICGRTMKIMPEMMECGAAAISIDSFTPVKQAKEILGKGLLLGNLDRVLMEGGPDDVKEAVQDALCDGVDGIWPGCDIWPETPLANLQAMTSAVVNFPPRSQR